MVPGAEGPGGFLDLSLYIWLICVRGERRSPSWTHKRQTCSRTRRPSGQHGVRFYSCLRFDCASVELQSAPRASKRFGAIPLRHLLTKLLPLKCSVHGSAPMCSPQALCSVLLNKVVLIPSTSVVQYVQIRYQQNKSVRKNVPDRGSTSIDALGTDCQLPPGVLQSVCTVLPSFQALPISWKLIQHFPDVLTPACFSSTGA